MRAAGALVLAGAAVLAAAPDGGATSTPVRRKVTVADNYYLPARLTVPRGSTIRWVWPYDNGNSHDVKLVKGPKGVKRFQSDPAANGYTYTRKLSVPGSYAIVCTLHEQMTMTIVVKR